MAATAAAESPAGSPAFGAFAGEIIDYAGMFPPARLDLETAVHNYARYRIEPEAWMLGRFVVGAARLADLAAVAAELAGGGDGSGRGGGGERGERGGGRGPLRVSVLVGGGSETEAFAQVRDDGAAIADCRRRHGAVVRVEALETRLPQAVIAAADPAAACRTHVEALLAAMAAAGAGGGGVRDVFFELAGPPGADDDAFVAAIDGIRRAAGASASAGDHGRGRLGAKLRLGGIEAAAVPPAARVARVLVACHRRRLPLKCTAGLHHPLRHHAPAIGVMEHGFFNVLGAGCLLAGGALPADGDGVEACVREEDSAAFVFDRNGFAWRAACIDAAAVARARRELVIGFGSCSFDEPRADLRRLGLLA